MNPALQALSDHRATADDVAEMLYGDGAWQISKALDAATEKRNRRQAKVGLASNALGITAGAAGLVASTKLPGLRKTATAADAGPITGQLLKMRPFSPKISRRLVRYGAAGAVGLQAGNLAGDAVANRVLARSAKNPKKNQIAKSEEIPDVTKGRLVQITVNSGFKAAKKAPQVIEQGKRAKGKMIKKNLEVTWVGEISKANEDKRQVFGWASVVELDGKPVVDLQGDYLTVEEIEKAAYDYVLTSRKGGNQHQRDGEGPKHVSDMIESMLVTPEKKEALGLPKDSPTGWWVGFQINDEDTWQEYKTGKKTGFSIHGSGVRKELVLDD